MAQVVWSRDASRDLIEVCEYIERTSIVYAQSFAAGVLTIVESIASQPYLGAEVPEYETPELRERQCQSYRIIYRYRGDEVEIVAIIHGARLLRRRL